MIELILPITDFSKDTPFVVHRRHALRMVSLKDKAHEGDDCCLLFLFHWPIVRVMIKEKQSAISCGSFSSDNPLIKFSLQNEFLCVKELSISRNHESSCVLSVNVI